jgi:hypothetical protein
MRFVWRPDFGELGDTAATSLTSAAEMFKRGFENADLIVIQGASGGYSLSGPAVGGTQIKVGSLTELKSKLASLKHPGIAMVMVTVSSEGGLLGELSDHDRVARSALVAVLRESGFSVP